MDAEERNIELEAILSGLNERERRFAEHYCRYMSKANAARFAGYSKATAPQIGFQVYHRPHVFDAIKRYLKFTSITPEDNIKLIQRTAEINLADYFVTTETWQTVRTKVPLKKIIDTLRVEIEVENDYMFEAEGLSQLEITEGIQSIRQLRNKLKKYEAELRYNPSATRFDYVEKLVKEKVLNIDKMIADRVPLKGIRYTKEGVQVETYSSIDAQNTLAKINGSFETDNEQKRPIINNNLTSERIKEIAEKLENDV